MKRTIEVILTIAFIPIVVLGMLYEVCSSAFVAGRILVGVFKK